MGEGHETALVYATRAAARLEAGEEGAREDAMRGRLLAGKDDREALDPATAIEAKCG